MSTLGMHLVNVENQDRAWMAPVYRSLQGYGATGADLAEAWGVSIYTAYERVRLLKASGYIKTIGGGKGTRYRHAASKGGR